LEECFGYYLYIYIQTSITFLLPFAAGGFIYIAVSDLIPEIRKEVRPKRSFGILLVFLLGVAIMVFLKFFE